MGTFKIEGGKRLKGDIIPQGAKNEVLQVLCATLLTSEKVIIHNIPDIADVNNLISLLKNLGVTIEKINNSSYSFQAINLNSDYLYSEDYRKKAISLRGSIMIIAPLLIRFGFAQIPNPGGDKIGRRRVDTHFIGLRKLGAKFIYEEKTHFYQIKSTDLTGTYMLLDEAPEDPYLGGFCRIYGPPCQVHCLH